MSTWARRAAQGTSTAASLSSSASPSSLASRFALPLCCSLALALGPGGPFPVPPASAHIPTEGFLSSRGGGGGLPSSERAALAQLAAPPTAVGTRLRGDFPSAPSVDDGFGAEGQSTGASTSGPAPAPAPGTMVGTPNYARRMAAAAPRSTAGEAAEALQLLSSAREATDSGEHERALALYSRLVSDHPDLALSEYGRIGRALQLYQVGRTSDSILALEDEEVSMRGAAEVHAALAALLYAERPNLVLRAEEEWALSQLFDKRYSNPEWVRANKHWPPRAVAALQKFLSLS